MDFKRNVIKNMDILNRYMIIGTELKSKRIQLGLSLKEVSEGICSLSYLSKVENYEITANLKILEEIAKRLRITNEQFMVLFKSESYLALCIKAYCDKDYEELEREYMFAGKMVNYRSKMICSLYMIYKNNLNKASKILEELNKISASMTQEDLYILNFENALYNFKDNNLSETKRICKKILEEKVKNEPIYNFVIEMMRDLEYKVTGQEFINYLDKAKLIHLDERKFSECEKDLYLASDFEIKKELIRKINGFFFDSKSDELLNEIKEILENEINKCYCKDLYLILNEYLKFDLKREGYEVDRYEYLLDKLLYDYYYYYPSLEIQGRIDFLSNNCLEKAYELNDKIYIVIFKQLLINLLLTTSKYKKMFEIEKRYNLYCARWV